MRTLAKAIALLALALSIVTSIGMALPMDSAVAQPQAGATYNGAHDEGGSVSLAVAANGLTVLSLEARSLPSGLCFEGTRLVDASFSNIPIAVSSFFPDFESSTQVDGVAVRIDGDFSIPGFVTGSLVTDSGESSCLPLTVSYAASVDAASLPCPTAGDVDNDGSVSAIDALLILQLQAGLIARLPCQT